MTKRQQTKIDGFTLIELLVVIAIIGLLASVVLVSLSTTRENARYARAQEDLHNIALAAQLYYQDHGTYPPDTWTNEPVEFDQYLGNSWPTGPWPGSYYDWDHWTDWATWATPGKPGDEIVQISLRFCSDVNSNDCNFPKLSWAANFVNRSSVYYCISGPCRSHKNLPIDGPGKCVNCGQATAFDWGASLIGITRELISKFQMIN